MHHEFHKLPIGHRLELATRLPVLALWVPIPRSVVEAIERAE